MRGDALHLRLILLDELLKLCHSLGERKRLPLEGDVLLLQRGLTECRGEGLVYLMIGESLGVARKLFFLGRDRQRRQSLCSLPWAQIDDRLLAAIAAGPAPVPEKGEIRHCIARRPAEDEASCKQQGQGEQDRQSWCLRKTR